MAWVIRNAHDEYYAGFDGKKCEPVWFKSMRADCIYEKGTMEMIVKQLTALGYNVRIENTDVANQGSAPSIEAKKS